MTDLVISVNDICGTAPWVAIFFPTNNKKDTRDPSPCPSAEILSPPSNKSYVNSRWVTKERGVFGSKVSLVRDRAFIGAHDKDNASLLASKTPSDLAFSLTPHN